MSVADPAGLFVLGLFYGATVCSMTCLPYLGSYLIGTGSGFRDGVVSAVFFMLGKLFCYAVFGGLAGFCGRVIIGGKVHLAVMGVVMVIVGMAIPLVAGRGCRRQCNTLGKRLSLLALGASSSLVPCPPVMAMLLLAADRGSVGAGVVYGAVYGAGLLFSPLLIAGGGTALIAKYLRIEVREFMPYLRGLSAMIIVLMGVNVIVRSQTF